jgi:hypothetical protein
MAMRHRIPVTALLLLLGFCIYGQNQGALERDVDFSITLKELTRSLETGNPNSIRRDRFVVLTGTLADIMPKPARPLFFLLKLEDFVDPRGFLQKIKMASDPLAADSLWLMLNRSLSEKNAQLLDSYEPEQDSVDSVLRPLLGDLNTLIEGDSLVKQPAIQALSLEPELAEIMGLGVQGEDSQFLNRLLLESAMPEHIRPIVVTGEIVTAEWLESEEIRSYHGLVAFYGYQAYRIFLRRRTTDASQLMIPQNSQILVVAKLIEPVQGIDGELIWLSEAVYVRKLR